MRVLATFPELFELAAADAVGPEIQQPARRIATEPLLPAAEPPLSRQSRGPRPRRISSSKRFPTGSIIALALISAAIWTLVGLRERAESDRSLPETRLASEPPASADTKVTR